MGFKECDEDDFDFFCKDYEGMWFLLLIPGIMLVSTVVVSMMCYLRKKKNKDREIDAAHLNLDVSSRPAHIGRYLVVTPLTRSLTSIMYFRKQRQG